MPVRRLNIKPSRFGSLSALLDCVDARQAAGMELYGGGQFELGIGRDQIQALASLFYPDGPNDVARRTTTPEPVPGVPPSPLAPPVAARRLRLVIAVALAAAALVIAAENTPAAAPTGRRGRSRASCRRATT